MDSLKVGSVKCSCLGNKVVDTDVGLLIGSYKGQEWALAPWNNSELAGLSFLNRLQCNLRRGFLLSSMPLFRKRFQENSVRSWDCIVRSEAHRMSFLEKSYVDEHLLTITITI